MRALPASAHPASLRRSAQEHSSDAPQRLLAPASLRQSAQEHSSDALQCLAGYLTRQGVEPKQMLRGWSASRVYRSGETALKKQYDNYFFSPLGQRFRSLRGVADFLADEGKPGGSCVDARGMDVDDDDDDEGEEVDGAALEVTKANLATEHPPYDELVGSDVCVLQAAYSGEQLQNRSAVGWRAQVTAKRGGPTRPQVSVFGSWFNLKDAATIAPIEQESDDDEEDTDDDEEEDVAVIDEDDDDDVEEPQAASMEVLELDESQVAVEGESDAESEDAPPPPLADASVAMPADEAEALVGRRIRVWWEGDRRWFCGRVESYHALWQTHQVVYDDNDRRRYHLHTVRWELEGTAGVECMEGWEQLELRCAISFMPLTDPAKGSSCAHTSRCNYETLRQHVSRHRACPMAGCEALVRRTHDVVRVDALRAQLEALPDGTRTVWRRGGEIRSTQPEPAQMSTAQQPQQPQQRAARSGGTSASASLAAVPSSRAAGGKDRVLVKKEGR